MTCDSNVETEHDAKILQWPFDHVLVGVDGTAPALEACRQAVRVAAPGTPIELAAAAHLVKAIRTGHNAARIARELRDDAERALVEAARVVGPRARPHFLNGPPTDALLLERERTGASLMIVGSHGHRRTTEILIGGVAGELLHVAPCSVLIARSPADPARFPSSIVAGFDGSPPSTTGLAVARQLASRLGARVSVIENVAEPVAALVAASHTADLVVVGSRGLTGIRALGSVSERVAHHALCSVLVVRPRGTG